MSETFDRAIESAVDGRRGRGERARAILELMTRPQPVTLPMVALFAIIPLYIFIGDFLIPGRVVHVPEVALDRMVPLQPAWAIVYGSLFLAALLPVFVLHQQELVRRTVLAFLMAWLVSYAIFIAYPTIGPRPASVSGDDFFSWTLRLVYSSDVRYNCFPSLHVAQCFLAAFACSRVHAGVGRVAAVWAALVGLATLFTKQHYVLDVIGGFVLAYVGHRIFIRDYPRESVPERERRLAPTLAGLAFGAYALIVGALWLLYSL